MYRVEPENEALQKQIHELTRQVRRHAAQARGLRLAQLGAALLGASVPLFFSESWLLFACLVTLGFALTTTRWADGISRRGSEPETQGRGAGTDTQLELGIGFWFG